MPAVASDNHRSHNRRKEQSCTKRALGAVIWFCGTFALLRSQCDPSLVKIDFPVDHINALPDDLFTKKICREEGIRNQRICLWGCPGSQIQKMCNELNQMIERSPDGHVDKLRRVEREIMDEREREREQSKEVWDLWQTIKLSK